MTGGKGNGGLDGREFFPSGYTMASAQSDVSGRWFRQHPVRNSEVSGHLRIVAAWEWFLMSGSLALVIAFDRAARPSCRMTIQVRAVGSMGERLMQKLMNSKV